MADLNADHNSEATVELDAAAISDALHDPNAAVGPDIAVDMDAVGYLDVAADSEAATILDINLDLEFVIDPDAAIADTIAGSGAAVDPNPADDSDAIVDVDAPVDSDATVDSEAAAVDLGTDTAADLDAIGDSIATAKLDTTLSVLSPDWGLEFILITLLISTSLLLVSFAVKILFGGIFQAVLNSAATPHPEKKSSAPDKLQNAICWLKKHKLVHSSGWLVATVLLFLPILLLSMPTADIEFLSHVLLVAVSLLPLILITNPGTVGIPHALSNSEGSNPRLQKSPGL